MIVAPDGRTLLIRWGQQHPTMIPLVAGRVMRRLPAGKTWPTITVQRIGGGERHGTMHWIHDPLLQVDVRDTNDVRAGNIANTFYALIADEFHGGIVTDVARAVIASVEMGGIHEGWDPDSKEIALVSFDVQLTLRPHDDPEPDPWPGYSS